MRKNIEIQAFEHKVTKANKPYMRFKTNEGWLSCFDMAQCELIKNFVGRTASVEVMTSGEFSNIKQCYGSATDPDSIEVVKIGVPQETKVKNGTSAMFVSYAKDLVVAGRTPDEAIAIVSLFKKAFE